MHDVIGGRWGRGVIKKGLRHCVFPSKYLRNPKLLNFSDRTRTGVFSTWYGRIHQLGKAVDVPTVEGILLQKHLSVSFIQTWNLQTNAEESFIRKYF